jgi:hypothetical protein
MFSIKRSGELTPVLAWLDALAEKLEDWNPVCVATVPLTSSVRVAMRDDIIELPIALGHLIFKRAISCMRKVIHIEQESFQKGGGQVTLPGSPRCGEDMSYLPWL